MGRTQYRTHLCAEVNDDFVGKSVTLAGWIDRRRDHGGVTFVDLRDSSGMMQVLINDPQTAKLLHSEDVIQVTGNIRLRPEGEENDSIVTGNIELVADKVTILSSSKPLPFQVSTSLERTKSELDLPGEETRLKYRYLDLRRPSMHNRLLLRSKITQAARRVLEENAFTEVETPTLIRSTPEGARDFLVPARLAPGSWYALPQSPQLLKQLLMISGIERYYQLARSYRDEDFRADRQPEFTQLDLEMSYVGQEDVIAIAEKLLQAVWAAAGYKIEIPFKRISWQQAMDEYGSDKPDMRFGNKLVDLTEFFKNTPFRVFQAPYVGALVYKGGASLPRRQFDAWQEWAHQHGAKGLAYISFKNGELTGPVAKNLSDEERANIQSAVHAENGDAVFFAAGNKESSQLLLGAVRVEIAKRQGLLKPDEFAFEWVVDFPLFKRTDDPNDDDISVGHSQWTSVHHPFTMPDKDSLDTFDKDPESAMSESYDIVCNGHEIGGGSVRIHDANVQDRVLNVLGIDDDEANEKFGFLLTALQYGAPPHAGIAFGWDRVTAILAGVDSIRDVIAFPKSGGGRDPLTGAPTPISDQQRKETGVDYDPDEDE